jgi:tetrapyrrole methylase family protein/MazG family protein
MRRIKVVGIGPGPTSYLTKEAEAELLGADKVFFRMGAHPVCEWLRGLGKQVLCFDLLYTTRWTEPGDIYDFMVSALLKEVALRGEAVYAVPGSPDVLEDTTRLLRLRGPREGVEISVLYGVSFLDQILSEINHDFSLGLQVVLPLTHLQHGLFTKQLALIVCQIEAVRLALAKPRVDLTMNFLLAVYPPDHPVTLIWTDGLPAYKTQSKAIALKDLVHEYGEGKFFASLYVPPIR